MNHPSPHIPLPGEGQALALRPRSQKGIGSVIATLDHPQRIAGVEIEAGAIWPDDRGCFTELFRFGEGGHAWARGFSAPLQVSAAVSFPGTIKAMHYHRRQTDLWAPLCGLFQLVLFDLRVASPTFGELNTLYAGEWRPWRLRIPAGVAHGYKTLGTEPGVMVYATDRFYDPGDEGRIPHDARELNYDWDLQHR